MKPRWMILIVIAAGIAAALLVTLRTRETVPLNVLLISLDTARPDHLGCYGYEAIQTPAIDELAREGILFEDAITSVPITLPSHASMLTGLYPISHGIRDNGTFVLHDQFTTLTEILKAEGYATGAFLGSFVLDSRFGLAQGFDVYADDMEETAKQSAFSHPERRAAAVRTEASAWLKTVPEPFFAFVHYYDPHVPYDPPPPYDGLYVGRPYDGEIAYSDEEVSRVLDVLAGRDLIERTIVMIVSDHGEGLGQHDEAVHGRLIYDTTMRVIWILRLPGAHDLTAAISRPARINQNVELVDILPTVLDLIGLDCPDDLDGRSVKSLIAGESLQPRIGYMETLYPYFAYRWSPLRGIRFNKWKFILAPEPELYNLADDPTEADNLYETEGERAAQLKANLVALAGRERKGPAAEIRLSAAEARKLHALGYVSASRPSVPVDIEPVGKDPKHMVAMLRDLVRAGIDAYDAGDMETAATKFRQMVGIDPMNMETRIYLGRALAETGDLAGAEAQFLKVIGIDSTQAEAHFRLGSIYRTKGNLDEALSQFRAAAHVQPESPEILSNVGSILMEQGHTDSAMAVLNQALEIDPTDQIALVNLGLGYLAGGQYDRALTWFHRTLKANPRHVKALMNIAFIHLKRNQPDSVVTYLERARDAAPTDVGVLKNLGSAYRQQGMIAEAAGVFEAAARLEPDDVTVLFGLAATRAEQGRKQESIQLLETILRIDPNFTPARQALAGLRR